MNKTFKDNLAVTDSSGPPNSREGVPLGESGGNGLIFERYSSLLLVLDKNLFGSEQVRMILLSPASVRSCSYFSRSGQGAS